ncbi:hypothetical protein GTB64_004444 [Salmonella enterica]|nr:hypothetical protein [Salmonella enterica]
MPAAKKTGSTELPIPAPFSNKRLLKKVVPIFNVMHDTALTEKEAFSLIELVWRYANEKAPAAPKQEIPVITADAEETVIQQIRKYYERRPFILDFDGIMIEVKKDMSIVDAMRLGFNATLSQVEIVPDEPAEPKPTPTPVDPIQEAAPVVRRKTTLTLKKSKKEKEILPVPEPAAIKEEVPDEEEDQTQFVGLQTYGVNPGEPLSHAVARIWPLRPALLAYNDKTIPITLDMTLIDAQCEAADVMGVDGNHEDEVDESKPKISASGRLYGGHRPYEVAVFNHPIPVDDSQWDISLDRNSGAPFIRTERAVWLDGYPYRISCVPFDEMMNTETMFYVHCKERPSQEMFDCYHRLFLCHTHKVHVRRAIGQDDSKIMTQEYCTWRPKEGMENGVGAGHVVSTVMEALGMNSRWEPGARYRIRYWDTNINCVNHRYYATKPKEEALNVLRHPKLKPVIQTRPVGI